jgi:hypothetical protein
MSSSASRSDLSIPHPIPRSMLRLEILEANGGSARRQWLGHRLSERAAGPTRTWIVSCDFDLGGAWAGVNELLSSLISEILS